MIFLLFVWIDHLNIKVGSIYSEINLLPSKIKYFFVEMSLIFILTHIFDKLCLKKGLELVSRSASYPEVMTKPIPKRYPSNTKNQASNRQHTGIELQQQMHTTTNGSTTIAVGATCFTIKRSIKLENVQHLPNHTCH